MRKVHIIVAGFLAVAAVSALAVSAVYVTEGGGRNVATPREPPPIGDRLAAFVRHDAPKPVGEVTFRTANGETRSLADWKGRAVLVNLWATWCAPCRHEMPSLDRLEARLGGEDFSVVAISLDRGGIDKPQAFYDEIGIENLALYHDPTLRTSTALDAIGMPTSVLIDAEGREVGRMAGPAEWDSDEAVALITEAAGLGG